MTDPLKLKLKLTELLVLATARSAIAVVLMERFSDSQNSVVSIEALQEEVVSRIKNAQIDGLRYDQQAKLVERALKSADAFFRHYENMHK